MGFGVPSVPSKSIIPNSKKLFECCNCHELIKVLKCFCLADESRDHVAADPSYEAHK